MAQLSRRTTPLFFLNVGDKNKNIEGSLFQDTDTLNDGNVSPQQIFASKLTDADDLTGGEIIQFSPGDTTLFGSKLTDTDTFFNGLIAPTNLFGSQLQDTDTFFDGLVDPTNMFGGTFTDSDTINDGEISVSLTEIQGSLLSDTDNFNSGEFSLLNVGISGSKIGQNINVISSIISNSPTNSTSSIVTLPNGSNVVGRLIIACVASDGTPTFTWPVGWTELFDSSSTEVALGIAYRVVDGTEGFDGSGDTIKVTLSTGETTAHIAYLVENFSSNRHKYKPRPR
jgi:hypothetical protein